MRILFAGTGDIGIPTIRFLVATQNLVGILTQPDRPAGRSRTLKVPPIKEEVRSLAPGIPILQPESPRLPEVISWVRNLFPEVIVTMAYGRVLPVELLEAPSLACLNIHASLLPRHRGASPVQSAIASGDRESGITIMYMAEGLDTGDILLRERVRISRRETTGSLSQKLADLAPNALSEALDLITANNAPRIGQLHQEATLSRKIGREESIIDWSGTATELERKIRSLQPRPAACARLPLSSGKEAFVKVHSAIVIRRASGIAGTILQSDRRGVLVACGEGGLLLGSIQPEGRGIMHSSAFARGYSLLVGKGA